MRACVLVAACVALLCVCERMRVCTVGIARVWRENWPLRAAT